MRRWPAHLGAVVVAIASALLFTWPLAVNAQSHVLGAIFHWDAYTNAMLMGSRVDAALGRAPMSIYASYYFAPLPDSIVFNENLFGLSLVFAPFYLLSGNGLFAYNMTLLVTLALSVFFTYLLVRHLTGSAWAGVVCGVAFAYCPYVVYELGRIQLTATPWIPAAFLFLHRALERERLKDALGFFFALVMQIGSGLYYVMFLVPALAVLSFVLVARYRPSRRWFVRFGAAAAGAGVLALGMVYPYFSARRRYNLDRSLEYASAYDGKFSFFANVHPTNLSLKGLHHVDNTGRFATEIAFPSFTASALVLLALAVAALRALSHAGPLRTFAAITRWMVLALLAFAASLLTHSLLTCTLAVGIGVWWFARHPLVRAFGGNARVYFILLLLSVTMFLGIHPWDFEGEPVRGLYYYFYRYFPGFNGLRHVSRQAVLTTFFIVVLAGFGGAWLFSRCRARWTRGLLGAAVLGGLCYELRSFPHPLERVWAGAEAPRSLSFAAMLPANDLLAFLPQASGREVFRGDAGMAHHNLLALHHKHRFVNGQSSYEPEVTTLGFRAMDQLPADGARRALLSMGAKHLVIFGEDLAADRAGLPDMLSAQPDKFRRIFYDGKDSIFTLLEPEPESLELLSTPELPRAARLIPQRELRAAANLQPALASLALDGKADSFWTSGRSQAPGQYFEIALAAARPVIALEIDVPGRVWDVPASFRLTAANGNEAHGVIMERPGVRLYRSQIFDPKNFVFRLVLREPVTLDHLRITVMQPVPGSYFSIHELRVYEAQR